MDSFLHVDLPYNSPLSMRRNDICFEVYKACSRQKNNIYSEVLAHPSGVLTVLYQFKVPKQDTIKHLFVTI